MTVRARAKSLFCLAAILLLASPAIPQNSSRFTIKTATDLVLVNVTVRDRNGNFVRDLKPEDFTVLEDGRPQEILSMDMENTGVIDASAPQAANLLGTLNPTAAGPSQPEPQPLSSEEFRDRRLIVLFFDLSSMQPDEIFRAVQSAEDYVDKQMTPADLVALVTLSNTLKVEQDFTADRAELKAALDAFNPESANGFEQAAAADDASSDAQAQTDDSTAFTADDTEYNVFNTDRRLDALQSIADTLSGIEQKKSLLYFSSGLSRTGVENQAQLRAATNAAVRANLSIYTIDARGLQAIVPGGAASQASSRGAFSGKGARQAFDSNAASQETLVALANDTGGKAFLDDNDFRPAFVKMQEDTALYYVLGYTSANTVKDGRYRKISVTVKRKDVKIESRRGYYAEADFEHTTKQNRETQLQQELASELSSTDLPIYLSTGYFRLEDTRYFVPVSIVVPGSAIPFARDSDQDRATLDLAGMVLGEGNRPYGTVRDTVKLALDATQEVQRKNVQYDSGFLLPPGSYRLKFVLRENQTGQVGSFETNIFVPNLKDAPVRISSVIPSSQKQPAKPKKDNPLFRDGSEIIPSVSHVFSSGQHLYLYYEIYDAGRPSDADPKEKSAIRVLTNAVFFKGDKKAYETPLTRIDRLTTPERHAAAVELDVALSQLKPGFYTCQINVVDDASGRFVFPRVGILVR